MSQWSIRNYHDDWLADVRENVLIVKSCRREMDTSSPQFDSGEEDVLQKEEVSEAEPDTPKKIEKSGKG